VGIHRPGTTPRPCHRHRRRCLSRQGRSLLGTRTRGKGRPGRRRRKLQAAPSSKDPPHTDATSRDEELAARTVSAASCDQCRPSSYSGRCHGSSAPRVRRLAHAPTQGKARARGLEAGLWANTHHVDFDPTYTDMCRRGGESVNVSWMSLRGLEPPALSLSALANCESRCRGQPPIWVRGPGGGGPLGGICLCTGG
jgi:hypothetical protein